MTSVPSKSSLTIRDEYTSHSKATSDATHPNHKTEFSLLSFTKRHKKMLIMKNYFFHESMLKKGTGKRVPMGNIQSNRNKCVLQ